MGDSEESLREVDIGVEQEDGKGYPNKPIIMTEEPTDAQDRVQLTSTSYHALRVEEGADLEGGVPYEAYFCLFQVYGDHVHQQNGHNMYRGTPDDEVWQM